MQSLDLAAVLGRLEAACIETPHGVIAFDADGTLWSGDVGEDFFHALVARRAIKDYARDALVAEAHQHKIKVELGASPTDVARALYDAYVEGRYPEERTCEMMAWACAGWDKAEIEKHCRGVVEVGRLTSRIHDEVYGVLQWARERGVRTLVVSASPREIVEVAVAKLGIAPEDVVASSSEYLKDKLTTQILRPIPYAEGKVTALRKIIGDLPLIAAFGDNAFDVALLAQARVAVAVRPKERLRARAHELPGLIELVYTPPRPKLEAQTAQAFLEPERPLPSFEEPVTRREPASEEPPAMELIEVEDEGNERLRMIAAGATDIGRGRKHNEDTVLVRRDLELYVVADGAGGHNAGNVASALATTSIANAFETTADQMHDRPDIDSFGLYVDARRLASAIHKANKDVVELAKSSQRFRGMGTTVVAVVPSLASGVIHVAHVGDSRCYRWRMGQLEALTHDHSLLNDVLERWPDVEDAAIAKLPRNVVTRALGMEETVRASVRTFDLMDGDRYLLCSDGLTDTLDHEAMSAMVGDGKKSPEQIVKRLIDSANMAGAKDNLAALVLICELAPGASNPGVRVRPARRRLATRSEDEIRAELERSRTESDPEIVIIEVEDSPTVVPANSASDEWIDALDTLVGHKPSDKQGH
ncbi:MAG TPA: haloacid dehalogenase-like hydrolase [Polyangiaceae bacterium]